MSAGSCGSRSSRSTARPTGSSSPRRSPCTRSGARKRDELFSSLQVGQRVKGNVRSIAPFGVFVDWAASTGSSTRASCRGTRSTTPSPAIQVGEEVEAEVIDINHERGRISLSIVGCSPTVELHGRRPQGRRHHRGHRHQGRQLQGVRARAGRASRASSTSASCRTSASPIRVTWCTRASVSSSR
ncbi:MAG: S1 RNA-binding domain-containing protein [Chloroflexota bacterium]